MAEQDRYGAHFGQENRDAIKDRASRAYQNSGLSNSSGSEVDRYGNYFGDKMPSGRLSDRLPHVSGAEQDRYEHWFGGKTPYYSAKAKEYARKLPQTSGAEQDRWASHFGGTSSRLPSAQDVSDHLPSTSGAEQDRLGGWFQRAKDKAPSLDEMKEKFGDNLPRTSGAEQDRLGGWFQNAKDKAPSFGEMKDKVAEKMSQTSGAEQDRLGGWFQSAKDKAPSLDRMADKVSERMPRAFGAEQDRFGSHFSRYPTNPINATAIGLLQSAVLPSFGFHAGLSGVAYAVARYTDRAEVKDYLWPAGMTANAWWSAVGTRVFYDGLTIPEAWSTITYSQRLLLTGVTVWGLRLLYRVASRGLARGSDDPRYTIEKKQDPGNFWNKALLKYFIPEAVAQTLISLPFTLPFRAGLESVSASPKVGYNFIFSGLAVFLFSTGLALEVLADTQLEAHKQKNSTDVNREGVWSIVRHPNYLGDALIHASFPLLLLGASALHPITLIGPVANYLFLRFVSGDRQNEEYQEQQYAKKNPAKAAQFEAYKTEKNSFWPSLDELKNQWTWVVAGTGVVGVALEQGIKAWARS